MNPKITVDHLRRRAAVYVRQSTVAQLTANLESKRRQYQLVEMAQELGFAGVDVIDEDLGKSGSGLVDRPGFRRLVGAVCAGDVGAVLCIEASRLARNGRDWHHLIDLCGLVGTLVIDPDGVYDPQLVNDRLLLGLKGTMSEFELTLLRQRSLEALRAKAKRGELQFGLPVGLCWTKSGRVELEPDLRIQEAIGLVFHKYEEVGSVRQVLLWFRGEGIELPTVLHGELGRDVVWRLPVYGSVLAILQNPFYAGAYAFGRSETRTHVVDGRARKTTGHRKPIQSWAVLIREHHPGYITWQQFERNQAVMEENAHMKGKMGRKAGRGGQSLLAGLLRCARCGRMLHVAYTGRAGAARYDCRGAHINHGTARCISFGRLRPDEAVGSEVLRAVQQDAIEAALEAAEEATRREVETRRALELELEQARYEARLAGRRYEAVDPENRLVASELESRWNAALRHVDELERQLQKTAPIEARRVPGREELLSLAQDLPSVWNAQTTDMRLKQRIVRILIREVVADVDGVHSQIVLMIHWVGGRHSELRVSKNKTGHHSRSTEQDAVDIVRRMAGRWPDETIAATLNRQGLRTGAGNAWTKGRVSSARSYHRFPAFDPTTKPSGVLTLADAATHLRVSTSVVRRLIISKVLPATQCVTSAPWEIAATDLDADPVREAVRLARARGQSPRIVLDPRQPSMFPTT